MRGILLLFLLLGILVNCGIASSPKLEKFDRPPKFPQTCTWVDGKYQCRYAAIWDHSSEARNCLTRQEFIIITTHTVALNYTIDLYETQVDRWNNQ